MLWIRYGYKCCRQVNLFTVLFNSVTLKDKYKQKLTLLEQ